MTPDRHLELFGLKDSSAVPKCRLRALYDPHPECCLLEWSASQNLLISTRSSPVIDVFEHTGVYCYTITLDDNTFDARKIITQIQTIPSDDPQCYDTAYILQLNSKFSIYKLGSLFLTYLYIPPPLFLEKETSSSPCVLNPWVFRERIASITFPPKIF